MVLRTAQIASSLNSADRPEATIDGVEKVWPASIVRLIMIRLPPVGCCSTHTTFTPLSRSTTISGADASPGPAETLCGLENVAPLSVDLEKKISPIPDRVSCQATLIASSSETAITGAKPSPAEFDMLTGSVKVMPRSVERMATTCFAPLCVLTQAT